MLGAIVAAHLAYDGLDLGRDSYAVFFDLWLVALGLAAVAGLSVIRAVALREQRAAWLALALAVLTVASAASTTRRRAGLEPRAALPELIRRRLTRLLSGRVRGPDAVAPR